MAGAEPENRKLPFPLGLIAADTLATIGLGISIAELATESSTRPLGWVSPELVWPLFWSSVVVAAGCGYKMIEIVRERQRERAGGSRRRSV